jgi:hypothetical protein
VRAKVQKLLDEHDLPEGPAPDDNLKVEGFFHAFLSRSPASKPDFSRRAISNHGSSKLDASTGN